MKFHVSRLNAKTPAMESVKELRLVKHTVDDAKHLAILMRAISYPDTITEEDNMKLGQVFGLLSVAALDRKYPPVKPEEPKMWGG